MTEQDQRYLLGRIAVQLKMITMDQLVEATGQQARQGGSPPIGNLLVELGMISPTQMETIARIQKEYLAKRAAMQAGGLQPTRADTPAAAPSSGTTATRSPGTQSKTAAPTASPAAAPRAAGGLQSLLAQGVAMGASDVHIHSGAPVIMRVNGGLRRQGEKVVTAAQAEAMLVEILSPEDRAHFLDKGEIDFAHTLPGVGRFRANIFRQQRGVDGVFRAIHEKPPGLLDLGLPTSLARFTTFHQGMVLVTGPAGCGKSSTLAALVNIINEERREHILTIEDPVEYLHPSKRCIVNQRQVVRHTESFARALRAALREDPDVIGIGELRDLETISLALTAAETGHLVLATLHTNNTTRTINRLLGVFPPGQQPQVRTMLSESLRAIVSQRLVNKADGSGRVPALEVLVVNKAVGNLIRDNKTFQIRSILQMGSSQGMCLLDGSLEDLVKSGTVSRDQALRQCEDPKRFAA